jgi:SPP1 family predicted phage head-tail adaptor
MARVRSGSLDCRITIRRASVASSNGFNEPVETWTDLATVWAMRRDASAGESYRALEVGAQISARFTVRWSAMAATIDPRDRVRFEGREYNITAVRNSGRRRWREIDAVARAEA